MKVRRFCSRLGIPSSTWYYWRQGYYRAKPVKRWPAPVVDRIEEPAAQKAFEFSAWGHRKIWAMLRADGTCVSQSSVKRALKRRGLLLPVRYQAERRTLAKHRRAAFDQPPMRRNRVWQMDFSEFETTTHGTWQLSAVVDYAAKLCLACSPSGTQRAEDAVRALEAAIEQAQALAGCSMLEECIDPETGALAPLVVVTDNGPAFKSAAFERFFMSRPYLKHVRTRHRSPETNGVVERFFETVKYEHLYTLEISNGHELAQELVKFRSLFNEVRPHERLDFRVPMEVYRADPEPNLFSAKVVQKA
jgi:transposase InsO family protein